MKGQRIMNVESKAPVATERARVTPKVKFLPVNGGRAFAAPGATITFKEEPSETDGRLFLFELRFGPGLRISPHVERITEGFFILEGQLDAVINGEHYSLKPGEFLSYPAGTWHEFHNPGPGVMRAIAWATPGDDHAAFFEGVAVPTDDPANVPPYTPATNEEMLLMKGVAENCNMRFKFKFNKE